MYLFAFVIGIFSRDYFYSMLIVVILLSFSLQRWIGVLLCFALGWSWMIFHEYWISPSSLPQISKSHRFEGTVEEFPIHTSFSNRYLLNIKRVDGEIAHLRLMVDLPLAEHVLYLGESYQWMGRYWQRSPFINPGALTAWYSDKNRHIDGYSQVKPKSLHRLLKDSNQNYLHQLKNWIYQYAYLRLKDEQIRSVFLTLVLGMGSELSVSDWQLFKDTGTAHLMVVSGAHLSLVMGLIAFISERLWRLSAFACMHVPAKRLGCLLGLLFGFVYALVSGWGIPIQRAWLMFFFKWYRYIGTFRVSSWQAFRWSLWMILILEPHAVWRPGTYLSFMAVAIFMYVTSIPFKAKKIKFFLSQCVCVIGMAPFTCYWFGYLPILGIFANIIAIPWVSWLVLPLAGFVCLGFPFQTTAFEQLFSLTTHVMYLFLQHVQAFNILNIEWYWPDTVSVWLCLFAMIIGFWMPMGIILRYVGLMLFFCVLPHPYRLADGAFKADVFDVGQGLSVLLSTSNHHLLFDTGGAHMYQKVLLPFFKHQHLKTIDKLVISHPDLDHRAGYPDILREFSKLELIVDDKAFYHTGQNCSDIADWCWDGVCFRFLKYNVKHHSKNNHSCVLQVYNQYSQMLLTGDIERPAEYAILHRYRRLIHSTVMLVPHHGSQTSSSFWLLDSVKPKWAILSVAQLNAYHLPSKNILKRYQHFHIPIISTAEQGMISVRFIGKQLKVNSWKKSRWLDELL